MGTHGALAITYSSGRHECVERTLDGYCVSDALFSWLDQPGGPKESLPAPDDMGGGSEEWNSDREHEPEYYGHVDFKRKAIYMAQLPGTVHQTEQVIITLYRLIREGWKLRLGVEDCPRKGEDGKRKDSPCWKGFKPWVFTPIDREGHVRNVVGTFTWFGERLENVKKSGGLTKKEKQVLYDKLDSMRSLVQRMKVKK